MQKIIEKIESYGFECEAGPLSMCKDWIELKSLLAPNEPTEIYKNIVANEDKGPMGYSDGLHVCHKCDGTGLRP